jgi:hypothetical protein
MLSDFTANSLYTTIQKKGTNFGLEITIYKQKNMWFGIVLNKTNFLCQIFTNFFFLLKFVFQKEQEQLQRHAMIQVR